MGVCIPNTLVSFRMLMIVRRKIIGHYSLFGVQTLNADQTKIFFSRRNLLVEIQLNRPIQCA